MPKDPVRISQDELHRLSERVKTALRTVIEASERLLETDLDASQEQDLDLIHSEADAIVTMIETGIGKPEPACRLLLVEDDEIARRVILKLLANLGYQARVVDNGKQAIKALKMEEFDVVFMDLEMPEMDGLEATRKIREQLPIRRQPWIVALTGAVLPEDRLACRQAGADDFLGKPVTENELKSAIDRALGLVHIAA